MTSEDPFVPEVEEVLTKFNATRLCDAKPYAKTSPAPGRRAYAVLEGDAAGICDVPSFKAKFDALGRHGLHNAMRAIWAETMYLTALLKSIAETHVNESAKAAGRGFGRRSDKRAASLYTRRRALPASLTCTPAAAATLSGLPMQWTGDSPFPRLWWRSTPSTRRRGP